jgi:FAD/FMN-containing dehydrogenase
MTRIALPSLAMEKTTPLTREILARMKTAVDPNHILNPGKSFDE